MVAVCVSYIVSKHIKKWHWVSAFDQKEEREEEEKEKCVSIYIQAILNHDVIIVANEMTDRYYYD